MPKPQDKPTSCQGCPAYARGVGFVPPQMPRRIHPKGVLVGQGPGETEAQESVPFHEAAPAGWRLTKWCNDAGLARSSLGVGNIVQCWMPAGFKNGYPYGNRDPSQEEMEFCYRVHVGPWLKECEAGGTEWILPIGAPARRFLLPVLNPGQEKWVGTCVRGELPSVE